MGFLSCLSLPLVEVLVKKNCGSFVLGALLLCCTPNVSCRINYLLCVACIISLFRTSCGFCCCGLCSFG